MAQGTGTALDFNIEDRWLAIAATYGETDSEHSRRIEHMADIIRRKTADVRVYDYNEGAADFHLRIVSGWIGNRLFQVAWYPEQVH
jgi:hypothetical protein